MSDKQEKSLKYDHKPSKEEEAIQWDILLLYLIGTYKIIGKFQENPLIMKLLTMIDLATGWFELINFKVKQSATIENIV